MGTPLVSIITVVYNDVANIEKTILSVISQKCSDKEHIIIDGGSIDGTVEVIQKHSAQIAYFVSEKDSGIYEAMNKGIRASKGKWLNFMNSGDYFYDSCVISTIDFDKYSNSAVLYGDTYRRVGGLITKPESMDFLKEGKIHSCHQSMFFNRSVLKNDLMYLTNMKLSGDSELLTRIYSKKYEITYIPYVIADYKGDGLSSASKISNWLRRKEYLARLNYVFRNLGFGAFFRLLFKLRK